MTKPFADIHGHVRCMTASGRKADSTVHLSKAAIERDLHLQTRPHNGRAATVALGLASQAPSKITLELGDPAGRIQPRKKCSDSPASHKARLGTRCFESSENIGSTMSQRCPGDRSRDIPEKDAEAVKLAHRRCASITQEPVVLCLSV